MFAYPQEPWMIDRMRASCASQLRAVARRMIRQQELARAHARQVEEDETPGERRFGETRLAEFVSTQIHG